jgi:hypothetical protein
MQFYFCEFLQIEFFNSHRPFHFRSRNRHRPRITNAMDFSPIDQFPSSRQTVQVDCFRVADNPDAIQEASLQRLARYARQGKSPCPQTGPLPPNP